MTHKGSLIPPTTLGGRIPTHQLAIDPYQHIEFWWWIALPHWFNFEDPTDHDFQELGSNSITCSLFPTRLIHLFRLFWPALPRHVGSSHLSVHNVDTYSTPLPRDQIHSHFPNPLASCGTSPRFSGYEDPRTLINQVHASSFTLDSPFRFSRHSLQPHSFRHPTQWLIASSHVVDQPSRIGTLSCLPCSHQQLLPNHLPLANNTSQLFLYCHRRSATLCLPSF